MSLEDKSRRCKGSVPGTTKRAHVKNSECVIAALCNDNSEIHPQIASCSNVQMFSRNIRLTLIAHTYQLARNVAMDANLDWKC